MKDGARKLFKQKHEITATPSSTIEEEVENVEYLDDCITDSVEEVNGDSTPQHSARVEAVFKDTFYPNAVQCLIALYRDKYDQQMNDPNEIRNIYKSIWEDISKDMRESYFEFDADQVRQKFTQLRRQYFSVLSKTDAEKFEYFHHFHEMYNDKVISGFLSGDSTPAYATRKNNSPRTYRDDDLFALPYEPEITEVVDKQKHADEISHKEHEFMDMVVRELKAMDDESSEVKLNADPVSTKTSSKHERQNLEEVEILTTHASKRPKTGNITSFYSTKLEYSESEELSETKTQPEISNDNKGDMTLAAYNEAQQRRHEEKMNLLRQTLLLQQHAMELQSKLLEQIIKRV